MGLSEVLCTIHSNNYISYARALSKSFLAHHPDGKIFILLADERVAEVQYPDAEDDRICVIEAKALGIPRFESFTFKYSIVEINTAVKPYVIQTLFDKHDVERVIYLDPDILVYRSLTRIYQLLQANSFVLIPHITRPLLDGFSPSELDVLQVGTFNLGFIGMSRTPESSSMIRWWQDRLYRYCVSDVRRGLFVDQRFIDLVPSLFPSYSVLRDPGYDVAYWNLHERDIRRTDGGFEVNGQPLYFYHFSGIDPENIEPISKYQNRYALNGNEHLRSLFEQYSGHVLHNGYSQTKAIPYAYGRFDNGVPIVNILRLIYLDDEALQSRYPDPFRAGGADSYFQWLRQAARPGVRVTNLVYRIHQRRDDLKGAFQDPLGADAERLRNWGQHSLQREYGIHETLAEAGA